MISTILSLRLDYLNETEEHKAAEWDQSDEFLPWFKNHSHSRYRTTLYFPLALHFH